MTRRWTILVLLVAVAVVAIGGYAIGAGKSSNDLVLCATKKGGDLSLATAKGKCAKSEKKLTVAKEGPVGPAGAQGATGADANATLEAVHYVTGPPNDKCFERPATFCKGSLLSGGWRNETETGPGYERVGFYKEPNGTVRLVGTADYGSSGGESGGYLPPGPFFLPPGYRPMQTRVYELPAGFGLEESVSVAVRPDGAVEVLGNWEEVALDGISFRVP